MEYVGGEKGQEQRLRAVMVEVACPRHGRVLAEVGSHTTAAGPPCPTCGGPCETYAPMLALAYACAAAAPRLGYEGLLQALRQDVDTYGGAGRPMTRSPALEDLRLDRRLPPGTSEPH